MNRSSRWFVAVAAVLFGVLLGTLLPWAAADTPPPFPSQYVPPCTSNTDSCRQQRIVALEAHYKTHGHPTPSASASPSISTTPSGSTTPSPTPDPSPSTATTTPTPTPSSSAACVKPTAANTGVSGTRTNSSVTTLNTNGQTLENVNVSSLTINADNVTVRNVQVAAGILVTSSADNTLIDKVTTKSVAYSSSVGTTLQNSRITASVNDDALHVTSDSGRMVANATIKNNLIDDPRPAAGSHYDGIQVRGTTGLIVSCNTFNLGPWQDTYTAAVFLEAANGGNSGIKVLDNWLDGGGYIIYADNAAEFSRNRFGDQGRWGICYPNNATPPGSGNVKDADNTPVDLAVECR